jgi:hypothetical protein
MAIRARDHGRLGDDVTSDPPLEAQIGLWRDYLRRHGTLHSPDVEELEDHLRSQIAALAEAGLAADEAFLVAVKRMGALDTLSREFAREHSERLWKQLVVDGGADEESGARARIEGLVVVALAGLAAVALKVPELFGFHLLTGDEVSQAFYVRNASLFVFPFLAAYLVWKRGSGRRGLPAIALAFAAGLVFANVYPSLPPRHTLGLTATHLPLALWLAVGLAYVAGQWRSRTRRMDFVRFSGELVIYYSLIALGGMVLTGFTTVMFQAIGLDVHGFVSRWLVPCGALGAVVIGAWLVEAKQSVIENMAPVLTRLFTPLFTAVLLAFLATMAWRRTGIAVERGVLIGFDLLLAVVLGLVLYAVSARDPEAPPEAFDALQLLLVASALVADAFALAAIAARISAFGFSANKVAALGENVVLLVNLVGSAWLYWRFLRGRTSFAALERWQTAYLPVYFAWAWCVVVAFPPLFGFR